MSLIETFYFPDMTSIFLVSMCDYKLKVFNFFFFSSRYAVKSNDAYGLNGLTEQLRFGFDVDASDVALVSRCGCFTDYFSFV